MVSISLSSVDLDDGADRARLGEIQPVDGDSLAVLDLDPYRSGGGDILSRSRALQAVVTQDDAGGATQIDGVAGPIADGVPLDDNVALPSPSCQAETELVALDLDGCGVGLSPYDPLKPTCSIRLSRM